jgi:3-deoxy-D-manno-octulosonic-acid transferase
MIGCETKVNQRPVFFRLSVTLALALYSVLLALVLLLTLPWWVRELRRGGKYRDGFAERLGRVRERCLVAPDAAQPVVWVHAVSLGEVLAATPMVHALRAARPDARVVISTTTRTGQAIARERFGPESVFYFPADFAFAVRAWMRFWQPSLVVLVESELWPRFLVEAKRAGIPVAVVNARISSRSWPKYWRLRALWRPLLGQMALVHAQTEEDANRLRQLGAEAAMASGNLKYDVRAPEGGVLPHLLRAHLPTDVPVLVCGSTLAGEEALVLQALTSLPGDVVVVLAPRHPERFAEVAEQLQAAGRPWAGLSAWRLAPGPVAPGTILLLDSVGELTAVYALATLAVVGGGFLHAGGHNPLEPAALGRPIVIGRGYANFEEIVEVLRAADAVRLAGADELAAVLNALLRNREEAEAMGARAGTACAAHAGATLRAVSALTQLLPAPARRQVAL